MEQNYYCKYCGSKYQNITSLNSKLCSRHPDGQNMGRHILFEGKENNNYNCKFCGIKYPRISSLTAGLCESHPKGVYKGNHEPVV